MIITEHLGIYFFIFLLSILQVFTLFDDVMYSNSNLVAGSSSWHYGDETKTGSNVQKISLCTSITANQPYPAQKKKKKEKEVAECGINSYA